jgi:hypothetical protein
VDDEGIAIAQVVDGTGKLGTVGVLAAGLVGEQLIQLDTIELTIRVLVDGADTLITNPLAHSKLLQSMNCQSGLQNYGGQLSNNTGIDPSLTLEKGFSAVQ